MVQGGAVRCELNFFVFRKSIVLSMNFLLFSSFVYFSVLSPFLIYASNWSILFSISSFVFAIFFSFVFVFCFLPNSIGLYFFSQKNYSGNGPYISSQPSNCEFSYSSSRKPSDSPSHCSSATASSSILVKSS